MKDRYLIGMRLIENIYKVATCRKENIDITKVSEMPTLQISI